MLNSAKAGARGCGHQLALTTIVHEQAQSNQACNILQLRCFRLSLVLFSVFLLDITN